jgi:hypothetical protein
MQELLKANVSLPADETYDEHRGRAGYDSDPQGDAILQATKQLHFFVHMKLDLIPTSRKFIYSSFLSYNIFPPQSSFFQWHI